MTRDRDTKDPNVDTFDHVGARETAPAPAADGIHEAGPLDGGVQVCRRCGGILSDYRGAMIPIGDPPLTGWAIGAFVEVQGERPRSSWVTEAAPTCGEKS